MYKTWSFLWPVWFTLHWKFLTSLWHFTSKSSFRASSCLWPQCTEPQSVGLSQVQQAPSHFPLPFLFWKRNHWHHQGCLCKSKPTTSGTSLPFSLTPVTREVTVTRWRISKMWSSEGGKVWVTQTMSACVWSEYRRQSTHPSAPSRRRSPASTSCVLSSIPAVNMLVTPLLSFGFFHGWALTPTAVSRPPPLWKEPLPGIRAQCPVPTVAAAGMQRWGNWAALQPWQAGDTVSTPPVRSPHPARLPPHPLLRRPPPSVPHIRASISALSWEGGRAVLLQSWTGWVTCYSSPCPIPVDPSVIRRRKEEGQWVGAIQAALFSSHYKHSSGCGLEFTTCASVWCLSQCLPYKYLTALRKPLSNSTAQLFQINPTVKSLKTPSS